MQIVYNWHITEKCNYKCRYCFAKWEKASEIWKKPEIAIKIIDTFADAESIKSIQLGDEAMTSRPRVNFVGGEPLVLGQTLVSYLKIAQQKGLETSIITNGSLLNKNWKVAEHLDLIGISIDSFNHQTNKRIGRTTKTGEPLSLGQIKQTVETIRETNPKIKFKFNIVVNSENWQESVIDQLLYFNPDKIKVFRQLPFKRQDGISEGMFQSFLEKNQADQKNIFIEDNVDMTHSYLMIDPSGRLFQNGNLHKYLYSKPIHIVGIKAALNDINFSVQRYRKRYRMQ